MLKTFIVIGAVAAVAIAGILIYAAMQPDNFTIARATSIKAPPEKIYPLMSDFRRGIEWSPFEKKDPAMKRSFSGAPTGKGSVYEFEGNSETGAGRLEIVDTTPPSKVVLRLDMKRPFAATNTVEYSILPKGDATEVTWSMYGAQPFLAKVMCLFFSMDKMVGREFEAGLTSLKTLAES
jgi:uncharacterized protein YndB with AHSA1/START domain